MAGPTVTPMTVGPLVSGGGRADAGAFVARLVRLDPQAVARFRPVGRGLVELWAMLPFGVLAVRTVVSPLTEDVTVVAADLLGRLGGGAAADGPPRRRDEAWRWTLPPARSRVVETLPAADVLRLAAAASQTLRAAMTAGVGGRAVGERVVRDALLDHVPIVVVDPEAPDGPAVSVPQRLVQGLVRMGFVGAAGELAEAPGDDVVTVRQAREWVGLGASYGSVWYRGGSALRFG